MISQISHGQDIIYINWTQNEEYDSSVNYYHFSESCQCQ